MEESLVFSGKNHYKLGLSTYPQDPITNTTIYTYLYNNIKGDDC